RSRRATTSPELSVCCPRPRRGAARPAGHRHRGLDAAAHLARDARARRRPGHRDDRRGVPHRRPHPRLPGGGDAPAAAPDRAGAAFVPGGAVVVGTVIAGTAQVSRALTGAPGWLRTLALAAAWVVLAALMALALAVLYRFAPDRHSRAKCRWVSGGAAVTTLLWLADSAGLSAYVQRLGTYERMYGSLAG